MRGPREGPALHWAFPTALCSQHRKHLTPHQHLKEVAESKVKLSVMGKPGEKAEGSHDSPVALYFARVMRHNSVMMSCPESFDRPGKV